MNSRHLSARTPYLLIGVSVLGLLVAACNKQPNANQSETPTVAPPIAAMPLVAQGAPAVAPAPEAAALPPPARMVRFAPRPPREGYQYIDRAYAMGQAFADTPPDYAVGYQGTRPWIWRAGNGAYRIVERLPRGERYYYYEPGEEEPFLVRDPDYSYAYDHGELVEVYGPDGSELDRSEAARRADYASRYLDRAHDLYRAAQYQQRQSAYASEWARHRDDLANQDSQWGREQSGNADWRAWHERHAADEQQIWHQEQAQRTAYASAIGAPAAASGPRPDPTAMASRQAAYLSNWNSAHGRPSAAQTANSTAAPNSGPVAAPAVTKSGPTPTQPAAPPAAGGPPAAAKLASSAHNQQLAAEAAAAQSKDAQAKAAEAAHQQQAAASAAAAQARDAQAKAAQAAQAQQFAQQAKQREAAAAQAKATQVAHAQQMADQAKQHQAAAAQAKSAEEAHAQQLAAQAQQRDAFAARAKAVQAAHEQQAAASAAAAQARDAQAKAAQAAQAQQFAQQAKQREAAAAQVKAAQAAHAQQLASEAKQHEAAAAQVKSAQAVHSPPASLQPPQHAKSDQGKPASANAKNKNENGKAHPDQQQ